MGLWICFGDIILDWIQQFKGFSSNILIYWNIFRQFHIAMAFMMISLLLKKIMWFSIDNCETWPADIPLIILPYLCPSNVVMSVKSPIHRGDMDGYGWIWCIIQGVYMGLPNRKNMLGKPNHKDILVNRLWCLEKPKPVTNHVGGHCNYMIPIIVAYIGISKEKHCGDGLDMLERLYHILIP
jgi:hypothetical protein